MQRETGILKILGISKCYTLFQSLVGAKKARTWLANNFWKLQSGQKVIDAGCGPGDCLNFMPEKVDYIGFDLSPQYIQTARENFGDRGIFIAGTSVDVLREHEEKVNDADLVICNGVLHHLSDEESLELFRFAKAVLKSGGRFICLEPTFLTRQTFLSRWIMGKDRGMNIRKDSEWMKLARSVFDDVETHVLVGLIRIPYTHVVIECTA